MNTPLLDSDGQPGAKRPSEWGLLSDDPTTDLVLCLVLGPFTCCASVCLATVLHSGSDDRTARRLSTIATVVLGLSLALATFLGFSQCVWWMTVRFLVPIQLAH